MVMPVLSGLTMASCCTEGTADDTATGDRVDR